MDFTMVMAFEKDNQRVAIYKDTDEKFFVTNTAVGTALLCVGIDQALAIFDHCVETTFGSGLLN